MEVVANLAQGRASFGRARGASFAAYQRSAAIWSHEMRACDAALFFAPRDLAASPFFPGEAPHRHCGAGDRATSDHQEGGLKAELPREHKGCRQQRAREA